ncbi:MAG: ParB/RepB/Spo0J family partition protein [Armatimonadetes bacterium]|nr:ParB/RepB/Spo0J family partition protein [Armatimonadota bacterium]
MYTLPLDQIVPNPNQPRKYFDEAALQELAASIRERGVMEPIVVRPKNDHYEIVAGERRYRASRIAGLAEIPAVIKELTDEEALAEALLENFQREDLTVMEKARAIQSLLQFMTVEAAARNLGCSNSTLRRYLELLELPQPIQDELCLPPAKQALSGFTEGHARALRGLSRDYPTQLRVLDKIKKERLSVDETERLVEAIRKAPQRKEAFLRISLDATEEILKRQGVKLERRKNFKRKTAAEFLAAYQKAVTALNHLLDDEVTRFLNFEQVNQLLASSTQLLDDLDKFVRAVRRDLVAQDFGFMETYVFCSLCGRRELIGSMKCSVCGTVLKRCCDCGHYDPTYQQCGLHGFYVYASEAECPTEDSQSHKCPDYKPRVEVHRAA